MIILVRSCKIVRKRKSCVPVQVVWVTVGEKRSDVLGHFLVRENVPETISGHDQHIISVVLVLQQIIYSHLYKQAECLFYITAVAYITYIHPYRKI